LAAKHKGGVRLEAGTEEMSVASVRRGRVVMLVLDGLGPEFVMGERTPNLIALARRGGIAPAGGVSDLLASTHPIK
jgi:predicted AlkP superfamily pyrophosphatase or phosphodiesterase